MSDWPVLTALLERIGIDEIRCRKGQRYLTVVGHHDSGRLVFQLPLADAMRLLDRWLVWARRSQIKPFVRLTQTITEHRDGIRASRDWGIQRPR